MVLCEEDGGVSDGILVKVNVHTGEMKLIMANSLNNVTPLFRNAILYKDKIYFCGSVSANGRVGLPSIYEVDPTDDSFKCVYTGLENMQEYVQAYKEGVCTGIRGMAVYDGKLVISNVGVDGGYLLISDNPSEGFKKIATQSDLYNYPAVHFVDSVYGGGIWEMVEYNGSLYVAMCTGTPATRVGDNMRSFAIVRGDCSGDWNDPSAWTWTPVVGDKADGAKYTFGIDPERTRAAACNMCIYDGYLYIGEYNDEEIPLEELMFSQDFGFLARNLEQSVNLYRMSIGSDGSEQMELVVGEATKMFPAGGILCKRSGFGDYENQYFWQSKVFDGKLFLGTFDTSSLLEPLGQFTNGDLLKMSREEWASQIGYLRVLLKLLLNQDKNGDGTLMAADADPDAAIDAAVDAVSDESPELFTFTDAQHDTMRQELQNGVYNAYYSVSTLRQLNELNALLTELTDLVETNDIEGFVALYQKVNDLYASLSGKLPDALKKLYETLVRITELENMKDLCICLRKLSTATRGFGLYAITSEGGKLSLETLTRDGFGDPFNHGLRAFATNDEEGWMVIGTANPFMGTQLWRTNLTKADPMAQFADVDASSWSYPGIRYCVENGLMSGIGNGLFAPQMTTTRAQMVQILYNLAGDPEVSGTTPFTDLTDDWYQDAVLWGYQTGVVAGTSATTFEPMTKLSRAMIVKILYTLEGEPAVTGENPFRDVADNRWYTNAVIWAAENKIVAGIGDGKFDPDGDATREQVAKILYEYAAFKGCDMNVYGDLSAFADMGKVSNFAKEPMTWAVAEGLISGVAVGREALLDPQGAATREQFAMMMAEYMMQVLPLTPDEPDEPDAPDVPSAPSAPVEPSASPEEPSASPAPSAQPVETVKPETVQTPAEGETP